MASFKKATKQQARLRMAIDGPSGSGKTMTSLILAQRLGRKVALIDTERGSASKYAELFEFDVLELDEFSPQNYIEGIKAAAQAGYDVLIVDSLSHAWSGKGGILEQHDAAVRRQKTENSFTAWREVTPLHNALIDAILQAPMHVIATMRSKMDYVQTTENGKTVVKKVGMAPVQRDGVEYEFDIVADMDSTNTMLISKSRCQELTGVVITKPDGTLGDTLKRWVTTGAPPMAEPPRRTPLVQAAVEMGATIDTDDQPRTDEQAVQLTDLLRQHRLTQRWLGEQGYKLPLTQAAATAAIATLSAPDFGLA
jgi:hypothetical protein